MDLWLARIFSILGWLVIPVFLLVFLGVPALHLWKSKRPEKALIADRMFRRIMWVAMPFFAIVVLAGFSLSAASRWRFSSLSAEPTVKIAGKTLSGGDVTTFVSLIDDAKSVWAHHSHPINKLLIRFPDSRFSYFLGRDSDEPDEFWLFWIDATTEGKNREIAHAKQFQSEQLTEFLVEHQLMEKPLRQK